MGHCQRSLFLSCLIKSAELQDECLEGGKMLGESGDRTLWGHSRDMDPTNYHVDSIKKTAHKLLEMPHLWVPQNGS